MGRRLDVDVACVCVVYLYSQQTSVAGWNMETSSKADGEAKSKSKEQSVSLLIFQLTTFSSGFTHSFLPSKQQKQQKTEVNPVKLFFFGFASTQLSTLLLQ